MKRRIRVLQFITTTIGGAGEHVLMLAAGLDPSQYDVTVSFSAGCPLDKDFYEAGLKVIPIEMRRTGGLTRSFMAYRQLRRLLAENPFDIVHTHTSVAGVIGRMAAKRAGVPAVVHMIHAYAGHEQVPQPKRRLYLAIEKWLDRYTDHYVAGSDYIRAYGINNGIMCPDKITRIYYALRREHISVIDDSMAYRTRLGIPNSSPVAGAIARLELQKGLVYFIQAMPVVLQQVPDAHFIISGDGPLREALCTEAEQQGVSSRVHFTGWESEVGRVLSVLNIMVTPSLWEAFGIVNLEAMACGVPIVASRVNGIPEVVRDNETGLLVPPADPAKLAQAIIDLMNDQERRHQMGAYGQEWAARHFSVSTMVKSHEQLYQALVG
ncbi:glycogen synthase [Thermoflexales bacterium]|nr:glycogen synthase [Thermoflexales bacterium]